MRSIFLVSLLAGCSSFLISRSNRMSQRSVRMDYGEPMERLTGKSTTDVGVLAKYMALEQNNKVQAEYVWIDADGKTRSKTRTLEKSKIDNASGKLHESLPSWTFDGSSTGQAPGDDSEVIIKPVASYPDPFRPGNGNILVLCETFTPEGAPLPTNTRNAAAATFARPDVVDSLPWFGLEQEYTLFNLDGITPLGWPTGGYPSPQGPYYCGAGADRIFGRAIPEAHYRACLYAKIPISGINAEVMPGQWEYQVGPCVGIDAGDHVWLSRYILDRICEDFGVIASIHPKPITKGDWNGAGMHINFSTKEMREPAKDGKGGMASIITAINRLGAKHKEHIAVYGAKANHFNYVNYFNKETNFDAGEDNELRLTGKHETASINEFSYGVANRGCSVRIGRDTFAQGYGYFEDRRPASNVDPYLATAKIMDTVSENVDAPPALRKDKEAA